LKRFYKLIQYATEYQTKINENTQELMRIRAQTQKKERDRKVSELTLRELDGIGATTCFKSVGKMFVKADLPVVRGELTAVIGSSTKELDALNKIALKVDSDLKDAERNLKSLIERVSG
jgi:chaperonin cofactor prefoldin